MSAPTLNSTIGAIEIGILLGFGFMGAMVVQAYTYYQSDFSDTKPLKALVGAYYGRTVLEIVHTAFIGVYVYTSTVTHFGDLAALTIAEWSLGFSIPVANLVMVLVQSFFAYRVHCLSQRWPITIISWTGSFVRIVCALSISIISHIEKELPIFIDKFRWLVITLLVVGTAVDLLNMVALCYYLYRARSDIMKSRKTLERLLLWTIGALSRHCLAGAIVQIY
ncbi:uncharacterized protein STEHIDRAFT_64897 [Stereum hirsutum FP-91666 SS1]|uniref:uncharacterized protein n=1 Tax=Stereum hirsutum (strain FP-91666) TaxID=721885 RepID=UPI0004449B76|nr:uncharacterized protein STEHIDRAFT_64897 [Stereum hirsutum FP-91666 SS1]EIM82549.1 hypothetical protein STEHIDRAFT_64897 [Stereum hirsutum FP-91666 SS1]